MISPPPSFLVFLGLEYEQNALRTSVSHSSQISEWWWGKVWGSWLSWNAERDVGKPGQLECLVKIKSKSGFYVEQHSSDALTEGFAACSLYAVIWLLNLFWIMWGFSKICLWYFSVSCSLNGQAKCPEQNLAFVLCLFFLITKVLKCRVFCNSGT